MFPPARLANKKSPAQLSRLPVLPPVRCDGLWAMRTWLPMCHAMRNTQSNHDYPGVGNVMSGPVVSCVVLRLSSSLPRLPRTAVLWAPSGLFGNPRCLHR